MTEKDFSIVVARFIAQTDLHQSELEDFIKALLKRCKVTLADLNVERLVKIVSAAVSCLSLSKDVAAGEYKFTEEELKIIHAIIQGDKCNASVH